ncbi:MAG: lipocalin family protein, partial [Pseudomonadota bacterium]
RIEQSEIADNCQIGPFAHLRPESKLADDVKIGSFVEIKKSTLAKGAKANHLAYVGDASVGERVIIGAGAITCNYDGKNKHQTIIEEDAFNAIESYSLNENGQIDTTFSFNKGSFDGEKKSYNPTGYVVDKKTNAIWGMQFIWPFKADYRIIYLSDDYSITIIGRNKRDYVWLMAREPIIPEQHYDSLIEFIGEQGYDIQKINKVPQKG